jgi:hypothetical protein
MIDLGGSARPGFPAGWFIESLAPQTLVIFVIRTAWPAPASAASAVNRPCSTASSSTLDSLLSTSPEAH